MRARALGEGVEEERDNRKIKLSLEQKLIKYKFCIRKNLNLFNCNFMLIKNTFVIYKLNNYFVYRFLDCQILLIYTTVKALG